MSRLTTFLYVLMRDHLPVGEVHSIIANHVRPAASVVTTYSDKDLEAIAAKVEAELLGTTTTTPGGRP